MSDYGTCVQCGKAIDPAQGYSNRAGEAKQRSCIACQFPGGAHKNSFERRRYPRFAIGAGTVERIGISLGELWRRSRVAEEAHALGREMRKER